MGTGPLSMHDPQLRLYAECAEGRRRAQEPATARCPIATKPSSSPAPLARISLSGTLTIPEGKGPFPALVLVQLQGPFDRDEPLLNHRPFLVLADYLARKGIATLRYDVRGVGKSGGKFAGVTRTDLAGDVKAATAYLRGRPEIDPRRIGLLGHADGGRTAAIAADRNPDVSFLAVLSMASVPAGEAFAERNLLNSEASGGTYAAAEEQAATDRKVAALVAGEIRFCRILEKKLREVLTEGNAHEDVDRARPATDVSGISKLSD